MKVWWCEEYRGHCNHSQCGPMLLVPTSAIVIERDADGEWPDWAYEVAAHRLQFVGGTDQWQHASYRMAYLSLVFRALESYTPS